MRISTAPKTQSDEAFLFSLYAQTRAEELRLLPWDEEQKRAFLNHQFLAQQDHYASKYRESASFLTVKSAEIRVGRLYTAELDDEIRILDITISDEFRGKGIGTTLIEGIARCAAQKGKAVRIYLEFNNRSASLFTRLGFAPVGDEGFHRLWEKPADARTRSAGTRIS